MKESKITPDEYAKLRGISLSAVTKQLRANALPKGVISVEKYSRFYLLNVDMNVLSAENK